MQPNQNDKIKVQLLLRAEGLYNDEIDGKLGGKMTKALNQSHPIVANAPLWQKIAYYIQIKATKHDVLIGSVDGHFGPITDEALNVLFDRVITRGGVVVPFQRKDQEGLQVDSFKWPKYGTDEFKNLFGEPGEQIVELEAPFPMVYAFDNSIEIKKIKCNKAVHDSLGSIYTEIYECFGIENIKLMNLDQFAGCYVLRKMKGSEKWSTHAWGIATDTDPENNRYRWDDSKARFAHAEFDEYHAIYEKHGWINLGKEFNFDFMHHQACGV